MNIQSGETLNYSINNVESYVVWANNSRTIFYLKKNMTTLIGEKYFKHTLNQNTENDQLIYHEKDKTFYNYLYKTKSKKYIVLGHDSTLTSDFQLISADNSNRRLKRF